MRPAARIFRLTGHLLLPIIPTASADFSIPEVLVKYPICHTPMPPAPAGARTGCVCEILRTPLVVTCVFSTR